MGENDIHSPESECDSERRGGTKRREFLLGSATALGASTMPAAAREHAAFEGARRQDEVTREPDTATSSEGMVAAAHPEATRAGRRVLEDGGNAVDAAAAVQFAMNVAQPHSSGIGGGGFMLVYVADEDVTYAVDNRERAPMGADPEMFLNEEGEPIPFDERHMSGQAVGVPGTLRAIDVSLKRFGTKPMAELIQPAIELAAPGFRELTVDSYLAETIAEDVDNFNDAAREVFAPDGQPLEEGDELVQPDLAKTLQRIKNDGIEPFYKGEIAEALANTVQENGGSMTVNDLAGYQLTMDHPEYVEFGDVTVRTMSLPSSGGLTVGHILKVVEEFDLGQYGPRSLEQYHALIETFHRAYADRGAYMGDKLFVDAPWQGFLSEEYTDLRRSEIPVTGASEAPWEPGDPWSLQPGGPYRVSPLTVAEMAEQAQMAGPDVSSLDAERAESLVGMLAALLAISEHESMVASPRRSAQHRPRMMSNRGQTTHFTTADSQGNMVSWTSTIEQLFGTKIMVPEWGFMLNNELTDFDATPGGPNEVQPNKRPLSSTSPTIVFRDGDPLFTIGSPGGKTIITTVAQVILNVVEHGMGLADAIAAPRIYNDADPEVFWEEGVPSDVRDQLTSLGHELQSESSELGNAQGIFVEDGEYLGVADSRRDGEAQGI